MWRFQGRFGIKVTPKYLYEVMSSSGILSRVSTVENEEARDL